VGKRLPKQERHRQIIETAIQVFADAGFRGTTTKRIAVAAGVSEATVFLHFTSKEDLYRAILEEAIKAQEPLLQELSAGPEVPLYEALRRAAKATLSRNRRDKAMLRLLFYSALEEHSLGKKFFRQQMQGPFHELVKLLDHHLQHNPNRPLLQLYPAPIKLTIPSRKRIGFGVKEGTGPPYCNSNILVLRENPDCCGPCLCQKSRSDARNPVCLNKNSTDFQKRRTESAKPN